MMNFKSFCKVVAACYVLAIAMNTLTLVETSQLVATLRATVDSVLPIALLVSGVLIWMAAHYAYCLFLHSVLGFDQMTLEAIQEAVWTSDATVIETPLLLASCSDVQAYASDLIEQHTSEPALAVATKPKKAARKVCFALLEDDFSTEPLSAHVEVSSLSVAALELQDTVVEAPIEVAPRRVLKSCMKKGSGVVHYADAPCTFAPLPERPELEDCKVTFEYTCHNLLVGCMIGAEEASPLTRPSAALKASPAVPLKKTVSFIKDDVSEVRSYTAVRPTYECEEDCEEKDREWNETPFTSVKALKHQLSFERSCLSLPDRTYSSSFHQFEISGCIIHKWKRRSTTHFANWLILLHLGEIMPEVHAPTYDVY